MPAGITISSAVDWDQTAWELRAYYALRPELYYDAVADVQPTNQSMVGNAVKFVIQSDLATQSTSINESTDITPLVLADTTVTLTLAEYGAAVLTSALLRGTSFVPFDPIVANVVGFNAGKSLDTIALGVLQAGTTVAYSTGTGAAPAGRSSVTPLNTFGAVDARLARAVLVRNNVPSIGGLYVGFMHPDVSYDFRGQTGSSSWRDPHTYSQPGEIWTGEIGAFEGTRFVETPAPRSSRTPDRPPRTPTFTARSSWGVRPLPRRIPRLTATDPCPAWPPARSRTTCVGGFRWAGTGWVSMASSARRPSTAWSLPPASVPTPWLVPTPPCSP